MAKELPETLIAEYLEVYRACNTMTEPPSVTYSNGWFVFSGKYFAQKYRRAQLIVMRDKLRIRANAGDAIARSERALVHGA